MSKKTATTRPRVYARLRPMFGRDAGQPQLFTITDGSALEYRKDENADISRYAFDNVFDMDSKQEDVYESIGAVALDSLRKGFNSTILAYGQTGSGKTFSMEGAKDKAGKYTSKGLIPRIFENIFQLFGGDSSIKSYEVSIQFIELYNEALQDLLGNRKEVDVRKDPTGGYQCPDAVRHVCKSPEEAQVIYNKGCDQRATASTKMNEASSRSHALLQISVAWVEQRGKCSAQLNMVDLAGSEGMKKTGAEGKNAKEGIKINLSLTKLALTVKCLAEGSKHIPFRESKLTMMLAKGLGGQNMLHIILALSNSAEQVSESTACLRFGQSCLSMTVNPNANKLEKEQQEMKAVIKEQLQEISDLQKENEALKEMVEETKRRSSTAGAEVPAFLIAKHIEVNKDALSEDLKEATEQIEELKAALEEKKREKAQLASATGAEEDHLPEMADLADDPAFDGMAPQQKAEAMEARRRQMAVAKMKAVAENEQEQKAYESELSQLLEIQEKLQAKLEAADANKALEEERIRAEVEEKAAEEKRVIEEKAAAMEAALRAAEMNAAAQAKEREQREQMLQEELKKKEENAKQEEALRQQMAQATEQENAELMEELARLQREQEERNAEVEKAKAEQARLDSLQKEAQAAIVAKKEQEEELAAMRKQLETMAKEAEAKAKAGGGKEGDAPSSVYDKASTMIAKTEVRMKRKKRKAKADPEGVARILETLPVLSACNDLRALTDLEPQNRSLFLGLGGMGRMIEFMRPKGQNAPYATIIARTLPCVLDKQGRKEFHARASEADMDGEVRYSYLLKLLQSSDPDDKENACLAVAAAAQDCEPIQQAFFDHGIANQVYHVLREQSMLPIPRQRLQRVVVMAMGELANGFDPFKNVLREHDGVPLLLSFLSPHFDEQLIKDTLQLLGRMTQNNAGIQQELQRHSAIDRYSSLLFAEMHDQSISELAALALVNLCSEVHTCLAQVERHPKYSQIRFEMLASMARALSSSMQRNNSTEVSLAGSHDFRFWGCAAVGTWEDGNAGGDRKHTSFVENPQFLLRAAPGTNLCIVLQDTLEASREQRRVKDRPLFLRLVVQSATPETLRTGLKQLDMNGGGARVEEETGCVWLEPHVQAALDLSKTREVALRCHVKSSGPEDAWVIVPHVGCSHQHSKYTLAVFADREVKLEGELQPWHKRLLSASWTPLCSAPSGIADGLWRNCPQFHVINVGAQPTSVAAFLSYAERDIARNKRHMTAADPPGGLGGDERPLLSLYVMKSKVPEKRYVGPLSPNVDEYVAHSVVTNSWCVSARWTLEPENVYAILAVMSEGTTHEVPLRLTLFSDPNAASDVLLKPLSSSAEWHLTSLEGTTDENGCTQIELLPQGEGGPSTVQAELIMETDRGDAYCSIATDHEGAPHKMLTKYQQQAAVLSVPLSTGSFYTMTTRCITAQQQALKGITTRVYLYSTRQMQASAIKHNLMRQDPTAQKRLVNKASADEVIYGAESEPDDTRRNASADKSEEEEKHDPAVLTQVIQDLEEQRDSLNEYVKGQTSGDPTAVLENLRRQIGNLQAANKALEGQVVEAKAMATASSTNASAAKGVGEGQIQALEKNKAKLEMQLKHEQQRIDALERQLKANGEVPVKPAYDPDLDFERTKLETERAVLEKENKELKRQIQEGGGAQKSSACAIL